MLEVDARARSRFADALARGVAVGAAAKAAGYSRQQGWNLRNDPAFMASVEKRRAELGAPAAPAAGGSPQTAGGPPAEATRGALPAVGTRADAALAKRTLRAIANDPEAPAVARVAASKALIDLSRKPIVKASPSAEIPPALKVLPAVEDGDAARKWLEAQG